MKNLIKQKKSKFPVMNLQQDQLAVMYATAAEKNGDGN